MSCRLLYPWVPAGVLLGGSMGVGYLPYLATRRHQRSKKLRVELCWQNGRIRCCAPHCSCGSLAARRPAHPEPA